MIGASARLLVADHFTHTNSGCGGGCGGRVPDPRPEHWGTDLWDTDRPADPSYAGEYSSIMYNERVQGVVASHDPGTPLFLYLAPQDAHGPDQTLPRWSSLCVSDWLACIDGSA